MTAHRSEFTLKNGETLIIRKPEEADAERLTQYLNLVDTQTVFLAREPGEGNYTAEYEREVIRNKAADPDCHFVVAEYQGHIAAMAEAQIVRKRRRFYHRATMGISVDKTYWELGIGGKLMGELIAWCRLRGFEQLELDVVKGNERAIKLYESFGFRRTGTVPHAFKYADGTYADEITMVLELTK